MTLRMASSMLAWSVGCTLFVASARAELPTDTPAEYGATAAVGRPLAARNDEDATAAATSIDLTQRPLALETLRDVVPEVPGALALSQGGYGSFSSVSLRGTDLGQTVWLRGEIPLNGPDSGAFDLSTLPLPQLSRLEVYRGGAPVWYGQGSIGGVVRVVPREAEGTGASAQLGAGSFGLYELRGQSYVTRSLSRRVSLFTGVTAATTDNDYPYVDDHDDRFDASDRVERRIRNARLTDGSGLVHLRIDALGGQLDVLVYGIERVAGVPGAAGRESNARSSRRTLGRALSALAYTREGRVTWGRRYRVQLLGSAQYEARTLDDPYGELGLGGPRALEQEQLRGTLRAAGSLELARFLEATVIGTYAGDRFEEDDALYISPNGASRRHTEAVAEELRVFGKLLGVRGELRGSLRTEATQTALEVIEVSRDVERRASLVRHVFRVAGALEPMAGLTLRASWGTGQRVPTIAELFGDGVGVRGNDELSPEQGRYADVGFAFSEALGRVCAVLEANAFASRVEDKIAYVTTGQFQSVPVNLGRTDVRGIELGAELSYTRALRLVGATTWLDTETELGTELPRQPSLRSYGRAETSARFDGTVRRVTAFGTVDHISSMYLDAANLSPWQPLTRVGFGGALALFDERLELSARVSDVFDVRGQDYQRFPLPGRTLAFLISYREDSP